MEFLSSPQEVVRETKNKLPKMIEEIRKYVTFIVLINIKVVSVESFVITVTDFKSNRLLTLTIFLK